MPWRDADDDLDENEFPDEDGDQDDDDTIPCPHCLRPVYEDSERCPACGSYLSREDAPKRHAWWLIVGVFVCLFAVLKWVVR
jgi:hypothetical protein